LHNKEVVEIGRKWAGMKLLKVKFKKDKGGFFVV
jgi:hypothetical protein